MGVQRATALLGGVVGERSNPYEQIKPKVFISPTQEVHFSRGKNGTFVIERDSQRAYLQCTTTVGVGYFVPP